MMHVDIEHVAEERQTAGTGDVGEVDGVRHGFVHTTLSGVLGVTRRGSRETSAGYIGPLRDLAFAVGHGLSVSAFHRRTIVTYDLMYRARPATRR